MGTEGYRNIIREMRDNHIHIPLVAIGGIGRNDIPPLLESGVNGFALSGSVLHADNPIKEMDELMNLIQTKY